MFLNHISIHIDNGYKKLISYHCVGSLQFLFKHLNKLTRANTCMIRLILKDTKIRSKSIKQIVKGKVQILY